MRDYDCWPAYAPDQILPRLFQGGTEDDHVIGEAIPADHYRGERRFDLVVTLYADAQPAPWGVEEIRFGFPDGGLTESTIERVLRIALTAHERWSSGERVLIRCQAGVNRSGLVTALVLMLHGMAADEAIVLLRERRSQMVLNNSHFERFLRERVHHYLDVPTSLSA